MESTIMGVIWRLYSEVSQKKQAALVMGYFCEIPFWQVKKSMKHRFWSQPQLDQCRELLSLTQQTAGHAAFARF